MMTRRRILREREDGREGGREGGRKGRWAYMCIDGVYAIAYPSHARHHQHDRALPWGGGKKGQEG